MTEFAEDCIHLHACRRLCYMANKRITRNCHPDLCNCYVSGNYGNYIPVEMAIEYAQDGASSIRSGYSAYDVYCTQDLPSKTIGEIINEAEE